MPIVPNTMWLRKLQFRPWSKALVKLKQKLKQMSSGYILKVHFGKAHVSLPLGHTCSAQEACPKTYEFLR